MDSASVAHNTFKFITHCCIGSAMLGLNFMLAIVFIKFYSTFRQQTFYVIAWHLIGAEILIAGCRLSALMVI
jgi:hypothetical protein